MKKMLFFTISLICITFTTNAQFSELTTGVTANLYSVSAVNDQVVWAAGAGGVIILTTNGGDTWSSVGGGAVIGATDVYNIYGIDSTTALATATTSAPIAYIYRTTDAGVTWTTVFTQAGGFGDAIWMFDSLRGVFYGDPLFGKWSIWRTTDGGVTWDSTGTVSPASGSAAGWNNAIWGDSMRVAIGTSGTQILWSTDYGVTWTASTTTGQVNSFAVFFSDTATGYVGGSTGLLKTTNAGTSWTAVTMPGTGSLNGIAGIGNTIWVTRAGGGTADSAIHQSTDQGVTWTRAYTMTGAGAINHFVLARDSSSVWAVKTNGGVIKGILTAPVSVNDQEFTPNQFALGQNYPNPFNPATTIKYQIEKAGFVTLKVFDVLGSEVATLINQDQVPGIYTINFNAANLPSGIYMYQLKSGNFTDVKKMSLVK